MFNSINQIVIMIVPLLFAVTVHEVAHGFVAWKMGDSTARIAGRLTLNPLKHLDFFGSFLLPFILKISGAPPFGYAKPVPVNFTNLRNYKKGVIYVSLAGVIANLGLAVASGLLFQILLFYRALWTGSIFDGALLDLFHMLGYSVWINSLLAVFNMIPVPPLDGSRVLSVFLPPSIRAKYARIEPFGIMIIIFLLVMNRNILFKLVFHFADPLVKILLGE